MKKIIIYTTNDEFLSLKLVDKIISNDIYKNFKIDIFITKANFIRKIKIMFVFLFFGSLKDLFLNLKSRVSIKDILKKNKNCEIIDSFNQKYEYGLSLYCTSKIELQDFKIYNFHLGNLKTQRGSFIFFYKFIKDWNSVTLTFHEISKKFDVGKIVNEKKIFLNNNCKASDIFFIYLENLDFLIESLKLIENNERSEYLDYEKLNLVPSFFQLIRLTFFHFLKKIIS